MCTNAFAASTPEFQAEQPKKSPFAQAPLMSKALDAPRTPDCEIVLMRLPSPGLHKLSLKSLKKYRYQRTAIVCSPCKKNESDLRGSLPNVSVLSEEVSYSQQRRPFHPTSSSCPNRYQKVTCNTPLSLRPEIKEINPMAILRRSSLFDYLRSH